MPELSLPTKKLLSQYENWKKSLEPREGVSTIHVDEFASRVAAFYEKIRMIVDWKEEHLMRRTAIIRKLKRRFLNWELNGELSSEKIAEPLVLELIRGGHFPNDKIEESKIEDVQRILKKYIFIIKNKPEIKSKREVLQLYNWILEIAACEIEETLAPPLKENYLINYMFETMKERIVLKKGIISVGEIEEKEKNIQIYIAVQQALFKLDKPIISYNLIKYKYPQWKKSNPEEISFFAENIYKIWKEMEKHFSHPLAKKFYAICEKYDTPYLLLGDVIFKKGNEKISEKISNPRILENLIKSAYKKRLSTLKIRLFRAAFYSTLSILLTNSLSLYILEVPLAKMITGRFMPITIIVDILGPTFLMFLFTATIKPPPKNNLHVVIMETVKIVYKRDAVDTYEIKVPKKRGLITKTIIGTLYILGALISFSVIVFIFRLAHFPPTSVVINIIFIAIITFAGLAIRKRAKELTIEEKGGGFVGFISDIFFLPVAGVGRWLSNKWKRYNAIAAFFNALIDMPFSVFVEFLEKWRFFLKEKKEEIH